MKVLIFDFDGTLADTLTVCYYAFQNVFQEFDNRTLTKDEIDAMFGPSEIGIIRKYLNNKKGVERAIKKYYHYYERIHPQLVQKNDEVVGLLEYISARDFNLAVVTGKARKSLEISLNLLGLSGFFDMLVAGEDVKNPKPHPEGILVTLRRLKAKKEAAIYVGDSDADIEAGKRAKVTTIGAQWFSKNQSPNFKYTPDKSFVTIASFKKYLQKLD